MDPIPIQSFIRDFPCEGRKRLKFTPLLSELTVCERDSLSQKRVPLKKLNVCLICLDL